MFRLLPVALAAMATLAVPATADAKGLAKLAVCGPSGCVDRTAVARQSATYPEELLDAGVPVSDAAVSAEPFVRIRIGVGDGTAHSKVYGRYTIALLPRSGYLRSQDGSWGRLQPSSLRVFRRVATGVERWPAARLGLADLPAPPPPATVDTVRATTPAAAWPWVAGGAAALLCAAAALAVRRRHV